MERSRLIKEVRTAVNEGMNEYKALSYLAKDILDLFAKKSLSSTVDYLNGTDTDPRFLENLVTMKEVKGVAFHGELGGTETSALVSSRESSSVEMRYRSARNENKGGYQSLSIDDSSGPFKITLYYNYTMVNWIRTTLGDKQLTERFLEDMLMRMFGSTLVHELKHAVDHYRMDGAFDMDGNIDAFKEKYKAHRPTPPVFTDEDETGWLEYFHAYLNLPSEIWARFTQAVHDTKFYQEDLNTPYAHMPDGSKGITYIMSPLEHVLKGLTKIEGWYIMEPKRKKRLINVMSRLWQEENDRIKQHNSEVKKYL